jgi:DNA-binding CsgD family transcriptional regulator
MSKRTQGTWSRPPRGLVADRLGAAEDELVVLSFPLGGSRARLTPAEREILRSLLEGMPRASIARARATSERTVANQIASVFRKLGVHSRSELAARRDVVLRA